MSDTEIKQEPVQTQTSGVVSITFLENRKFELFIGSEQFTFMGSESKQIPVSYLDHPDFKQQAKYFSVSYVSSKGV